MVDNKLQNEIAQDVTHEQQDKNGAHFQHQWHAALFANVIRKEHPAKGELGENGEYRFMHQMLREQVIDEHPAGEQRDGEEDKAGNRLQYHRPFQADQ